MVSFCPDQGIPLKNLLVGVILVICGQFASSVFKVWLHAYGHDWRQIFMKQSVGNANKFTSVIFVHNALH